MLTAVVARARQALEEASYVWLLRSWWLLQRRCLAPRGGWRGVAWDRLWRRIGRYNAFLDRIAETGKCADFSTGANGKVNGLRVKDRASGDERTIKLEGVFVQIGLVPNTEWLEDSGLTLTKHGEIATDEEGRTNLPGVFAAGDVTDVPYKQIVVAMGEGSKAGLSAFDYLIRNEPAQEVAQAA